jgi:hypothetical protein
LKSKTTHFLTVTIIACNNIIEVLNSSPKKTSFQPPKNNNIKQNYVNNLGINKSRLNTRTFAPKQKNNIAQIKAAANKKAKELEEQNKQNKVLTFVDFSHLSYFGAGTLS